MKDARLTCFFEQLLIVLEISLVPISATAFTHEHLPIMIAGFWGRQKSNCFLQVGLVLTSALVVNLWMLDCGCSGKTNTDDILSTSFTICKELI